jgi:hypothetical protein
MAADEATSLCETRGRAYCFTVTLDPKADAVANEDTPKIIRAKEENGVLTFLVGYFAPPHKGIGGEKERKNHA